MEVGVQDESGFGPVGWRLGAIVVGALLEAAGRQQADRPVAHDVEGSLAASDQMGHGIPVAAIHAQRSMYFDVIVRNCSKALTMPSLRMASMSPSTNAFL